MSYFFRWVFRKKPFIKHIRAIIDGIWEFQGRIYWENITTNWDDWNTILGTFKFWSEQTKEYWQLETSINWENWFGTQGSLEMIEEKTSDSWGALSGVTWDNFE